MTLRTWWIALPGVLAIGAIGWLYRENRALERELVSLRRAAPAEVAGAGARLPGESAPAASSVREQRPGGGLGRLFRGLGRGSSPPTLDEPRKESRAERRQRRADEIRAMVGREPGESARDYRARVLPMVTAALAIPRSRMEDARAEAERAAGVTPAQKEQLDALFDDVARETIELTNQAIAGGDLTPYERNVAGLLSWSGGLGAILGSTQGRITGILSAEQRQILADQGFEWGEYLGAHTPWEKVDPPPEPTDEGGAPEPGG
jgi:hypothetical protein